MGCSKSTDNRYANGNTIHHVEINDIYYNIDPQKQNLAIIFDNYEYDKHMGLKNRAHSEDDIERLSNCLENMNFTVDYHENLPLYDIKRELDEVGDMDDVMLNCLLVIVLSCGTQDTILAADKRFSIEDLWKNYVDKQLFIGIPKIFIIENFHEEVLNDGSGGTIFVKAPEMTDYIYVQASYADASLQLIDGRSRYINAVCNVLEDKENLKNYDLLQLFTLINKFILDSFPPDTLIQKRHVPRIVSMLPKILML